MGCLPAASRGRARAAVMAYLTALTDAKQVTPSDDLLSDLVHISGQPGQLWPLRVRIFRPSWH